MFAEHSFLHGGTYSWLWSPVQGPCDIVQMWWLNPPLGFFIQYLNEWKIYYVVGKKLSFISKYKTSMLIISTCVTWSWFVFGSTTWSAWCFPQPQRWLPGRAELRPLDSWLSSPADLENGSVRSATSLEPADNMLLWSGSGPKLDYAASLRSSSRRFDYTHPLTQHPHVPRFPSDADETKRGGPPCQSLVLHFLMCAHLPAIYLITSG